MSYLLFGRICWLKSFDQHQSNVFFFLSDCNVIQVETINPHCENSRSGFGALHVLRSDPTYCTALAETDGVAFTLHTKDLNNLIDHDPSVAKEMVYSLSNEVLRMIRVRCVH